MRQLFPLRIGRLNYLLRVLGFIAAIIVIAFVGSRFLTSRSSLLIILSFCVGFYLAYFLPFIVAPRIRDIGASPWLCLVFLIRPIAPVVALLALFAPSDWWANRQKKQDAESSDSNS